MHSPEPWTIGPCNCDSRETTINDSNGDPVIEDCPCHEEDMPPMVSTGDMERIVACVNFCRGYSNEQILELTHDAENRGLIPMQYAAAGAIMVRDNAAIMELLKQ